MSYQTGGKTVHRLSMKTLWHLKGQIFLQIALLCAMMGAVMYALSMVEHSRDILGAIGASSLAASTFTVIMMPNSAMAKPKRMIGGYIIGLCMGVIFSQSYHIFDAGFLSLSQHAINSIAAALAVMSTAFFMLLFDYEHPPAVGLSIGLVLDVWEPSILLIVFISVIVLSIINHIIRPYIITVMDYSEDNVV